MNKEVNKINRVIFVALLLFLNACTKQPYLKENSAFIMFKTPTFRYADMGFIYENSDEVKVEIYGNGQAMFSLEITENMACMSRFECMGKAKFNETILGAAYPKSLVENIFRGKPIFKSQNLKRNRNGFTQKIENSGKYNIDYRVLNNEIIFHDTINAITIKVRKE